MLRGKRCVGAHDKDTICIYLPLSSGRDDWPQDARLYQPDGGEQ